MAANALQLLRSVPPIGGGRRAGAGAAFGLWALVAFVPDLFRLVLELRAVRRYRLGA